MLTVAGFIAVGGVGALLLARPRAHAWLPFPGVELLSAPTRAVIGLACVVAAYLIASPVFGWTGVRGPMGAIAVLAGLAVVGSIALDAHDRRAASDEEDQS